jgi:hypothetical protein
MSGDMHDLCTLHVEHRAPACLRCGGLLMQPWFSSRDALEISLSTSIAGDMSNSRSGLAVRRDRPGSETRAISVRLTDEGPLEESHGFHYQTGRRVFAGTTHEPSIAHDSREENRRRMRLL